MGRSREAGVLGVVLLLAGCTTASNVQSSPLISNAMTIERQAVDCKRAIANDPRYQHLARLLPLAAPYQASVVQMTNTRTANDDEIRALTAWTQDMQTCRQKVLRYVRESSPISLALVLSAWADEDEVFVGVIRRRLAWGVAATRLRSIQVRLLSKLTDQAIEINAQLSQANEADLSRRVAVFDAITNLAP
jgi:hypothetical protein